MHRVVVGVVVLAISTVLCPGVAAELPVLDPCNDLPEVIETLRHGSTVEAFGLDPSSGLAVAAIVSRDDGGRSVLRYSRGGGEPRSVKLAGRVVSLAITPSGELAYAIVRVADRKGALRSVELVRLDLEAERASSVATLPTTARGLAVGSEGSTLLVASQDEIRTFQLPGLASGPLYRALGVNVGVAPIAGSSYVLLAQPSRVLVANLAGYQDRDGLALSQEVAAPAPLTGMLASVGAAGPIAVSQGGLAWCVRAVAPLPPADPEPTVLDGDIAVPTPSAPPPAPDPALAPLSLPVPVPPPHPPPPAPEDAKAQQAEAPGTLFGLVAGPAVAEVAAIVVLGPDNVLHEAARAVPDEEGRFSAPSLLPGAYRLVAAGIGGRVLICDPPFITIRVDSKGAIEAPVLRVLSAQ